MYYIYILENQNDRSWYIGMTANLDERIKRHNDGSGAKTTARKKNWKLIYSESYINKKDALGRERFLKSDGGRRFLKKQLTNYLGSR